MCGGEVGGYLRIWRCEVVLLSKYGKYLGDGGMVSTRFERKERGEGVDMEDTGY